MADESGEEKAFFASQDVHVKILESNLRTGDEFVIAKKAVQNGKKVTTAVLFTPIKHFGSESAPPRKDTFADVMEQCLREAVAVTQSVNTIPWQNEDVRSIHSRCSFSGHGRTKR